MNRTEAIKLLIVPILICVFLSGTPAYSAVIRVIDGDTIDLNGERIRLGGIDAPEKDQVCKERYQGEWRCGFAATDFLKQFIEGKEVTCERLAVDKYKRTVATCFADGENINEALVRNGLAVHYHIGGKKYKEAEEYAKNKGVGMWYGGFTDPSQWRKSKKHRR